MNTINSNLQENRSWEKIVMKYAKPDLGKSIWQILNTFIPYLGVWYLMILSLNYSYLWTILLAIPAAGLLIRLFIIFHDCGHGSFFKSKKANDIVGKILGVLTFTPYTAWHYSHKVHHATSGNLDKRGTGDVWTLTVNEYLSASKWKRFTYKMYRHPLVMFLFGSIYSVLFRNRITKKYMSRADKINVYLTNIGLLMIAVSLSLLIGLKGFLLIQIPIIIIAHCAGIWLFYVQHQFDDVSWERTNSWDYQKAAVEGSSFLKLPVILQWFTGNIGFHHIHHLSSKIPNYSLARCHYENDLFKEIKPLTLLSSFKTLNLRLFDETTQQLITFRKLALIRG